MNNENYEITIWPKLNHQETSCVNIYQIFDVIKFFKYRAFVFRNTFALTHFMLYLKLKICMISTKEFEFCVQFFII